MDLQRAVDLTEPLGSGLAELLDQLGEPVDVGAHTGLHLAEALIDQLLPAGERGVAGLGVGTQLLAAHRDGLLDRQHRCLADDVGGDLRRGDRGRCDRMTPSKQPGHSGDCGCEADAEADNEQDLHAHHHDEGVSQGSRMATEDVAITLVEGCFRRPAPVRRTGRRGP